MDAVAKSEQSVAILRQLVDDHSVYRGELGRALANLGAQLSAAKQTQQAINVLEEAVVFLRTASDENPGLRGRIADALVNLGISLKTAGRYHDAVRTGQEAVAIFSAVKNATGFRRSLSHAIMCLGDSLAATGEAEEALNAYVRALAIQEELMKEDPDIHAAAYRQLYQLVHLHSEQIGAMSSAYQRVVDED